MEKHPAYKYSIRVLSKKDYSREKLKQKLLDRDYGDVAEDLLDLLEQKKYLREDYYVEARIKGMMKKNYSPSYIISKLNEEKARVNHHLVNEVFQEWGYDTFRQIEDLIRKKSIIHNWNMEDLKEQNNKVKMTRFIQSKGHTWDEIKEFF